VGAFRFSVGTEPSAPDVWSDSDIDDCVAITRAVAGSPRVLIGPRSVIADRLVAFRERWGFTSYVVPGHALQDAVQLARHLDG